MISRSIKQNFNNNALLFIKLCSLSLPKIKIGRDFQLPLILSLDILISNFELYQLCIELKVLRSQISLAEEESN